MSAEREISALWSRCGDLRRRLTPGGATLDASRERLLDGLIEELTSAMRRLETAGMLTPPRAGHLRDAGDALGGARTGRLPPSTAVVQCMEGLEALAASFRIALPGAAGPARPGFPPGIDSTPEVPLPPEPAAGSPAAFDYDTRPDRFRAAIEVTRRYSTRGDIHGQVATRLAAEGTVPVLDAGCGNGRLLRLLVDAGIPAFGVDRSLTMLREAPGTTILGDVRALPVPDAFAGAVASLYVLNHLPDPRAAVAEAWRVLRPGGLYVVSALSRHDSPEIADLLPRTTRPSFDAEVAPGLLGAQGFAVEIDVWDVPGGLVLPDAAAVQAYLLGRILPAAVAERLARAVTLPLELTRRGALVWGRKAAGPQRPGGKVKP